MLPYGNAGLIRVKKICEKKSHKAKKLHKKIYGHVRVSNPRPSVRQISKTILINLYAKWQKKLQVWQLVDAAYKAYEISHFVGLKEKKSHCNSLRFLRKAPTKN